MSLSIHSMTDMNHWSYEETITRIALFINGTCLVIEDHDDWNESDCHSGWDSIDRFDVTVGTFAEINDGSVVSCCFTKHFQRVFHEDHWETRRGTKESSDSDWQQMHESASLKWQRVCIADGTWEAVAASVAIGGDCFLGRSIERGGRSAQYRSLSQCSSAETELWVLLSWPADIAENVSLFPCGDEAVHAASGQLTETETETQIRLFGIYIKFYCRFICGYAGQEEIDIVLGSCV